MERLSAEYLDSLREGVDVGTVILALGIETRMRSRRLSFRCPRCHRFHTALHPRRNLARCFPCGESFNPIDLVLAERKWGFLEAVRYLEHLAP